MSHNHEHTNAPNSFGTTFAIAVFLNIGIVILQVIYGLLAHSTALLADATHNAGDVIGLGLAWGAYVLAQRQPSGNFTYGMRSSTVLAAFLNGMLLLVATGAIALEAVRRFFEPQPIGGGIVMVVAVIAILCNGFSAWLLSRGQKQDVNIQSAFWHLVSDALVSVGVVVSAFLIVNTGATLLDPITGLIIAGVIFWSTWGLFREALRLSLQAVPASVDIEAVRAYLSNVTGVARIHDLHVWPISTTETALTCHFVVNNDFDGSAISEVCDTLERKYHIGHSTIQLETRDGRPCKLATASNV